MIVHDENLARMADDPWAAITAKLEAEERERARARFIGGLMMIASAVVSLAGLAALAWWAL